MFALLALLTLSHWANGVEHRFFMVESAVVVQVGNHFFNSLAHAHDCRHVLIKHLGHKLVIHNCYL